MTAVCNEPAVIIMHTYEITVAPDQCESIIRALNTAQSVVLSEKNSNTCYFIIPADEVPPFLNAALKFQKPFKQISISDLREKYSARSHRTLRGDVLAETLFQ